MAAVEIYDVALTFDQSGNARNPLLSLLQQVLNLPLVKDARNADFRRERKVLVIDAQRERARYIAQLLATASYRPFIVPGSLDAYTLFLQGSFQPFAIILSGEEADMNHFFLTRISQQYRQRYNWKIPFLRLHLPSANDSELRSTGPLANGQQAIPRTTLPLSLENQSRHLPVPPATRQQSGPMPPQPATERQISRPARHSTVPLRPLANPSPTSGPISLVFQQPFSVYAGLPSDNEQLGEQPEKISLTDLSTGRYHLQSIIGSNPLGDVYLTYDRLREQHVALKTIQLQMIPPHLLEAEPEDGAKLFQKELDLLLHAEHPHLSPLLNTGHTYRGRCQFVFKTMPYYTEGSLSTWLGQFPGQMFPPPEVARVILQLADAIRYLHEHGTLYRNFKMANILVANETRNMRDLHVVLSDIPLLQHTLSLPKNSESYRYLAPEQWDGEDFTSSDQYGLAIIAYELLTGHTPFQGNSDGMIRHVQAKMMPPRPGSLNQQVSPFVDNVILRALSKNPADRFESVSIFADTLERAVL
jgi:hypothetical protein